MNCGESDLTRYLAVDLGDKRTGLATGDMETGFIAPLEVVFESNLDALRTTIIERARAFEATALVVGLPLNMDDTEGPRAKSTRAFGDALSAASGLPVHYQDERLTSFEADSQLAGSGRTRRQKKQLADALAAVAILRDFVETNPA